jgi:hypothetical protein
MEENILLEFANNFLLTDDGKKIINDGLDVSKSIKFDTDKFPKPILKEFTINGRIYDKILSSPLSGVRIQPIIQEPIYTVFGKPVFTKNDGTFSITFKLPVLSSNNKIIIRPLFLYTKDNFLPSTQEILTLDKEIKTDLTIFPLLNLQSASETELAELQKDANTKIQEVNTIILSIPEKVVVAKRKSIMKLVSIIQTRLFPLALTLLLAFGITKLTQRDQKICPTRNLLISNIARRNKIVKQLNQIFSSLILNTALATVLTIIINQFRLGRITIASLPIPLITQPYATVGNLQQIDDILKELESQNQQLNKQILIALIFLVASLVIILSLLKGIDELTQECAQEENLEFEAISQELIQLTTEANNEDTTINQINGFTLEVQAMDQNAVGNLKRRQAIGKNLQGIILIKGDPSFSSSDQILINELAFYIQSNDLKAF